MKYSEMETIEAGIKFKTIAGLIVETTGHSEFVDIPEVHVHEVVILEGTGEGSRYLHNLDAAELIA